MAQCLITAFYAHIIFFNDFLCISLITKGFFLQILFRVPSAFDMVVIENESVTEKK